MGRQAVYAGVISFDNGNADENPFNFAISGEVKDISVLQFLDNGNSGYTSNGFISFSKSGYFGSDGQYASPGSRSSKATWVMPDLTAIVYKSRQLVRQVQPCLEHPLHDQWWQAIRVNQILSLEHSSFTSVTDSTARISFSELSDAITLTGIGSVTVQMTNDANGFVIADAIRIEKIG